MGFYVENNGDWLKDYKTKLPCTDPSHGDYVFAYNAEKLYVCKLLNTGYSANLIVFCPGELTRSARIPNKEWYCVPMLKLKEYSPFILDAIVEYRHKGIGGFEAVEGRLIDHAFLPAAEDVI